MMITVHAMLATAQWSKPNVQLTNDMLLDEPSYLYNVGIKMFLTQGNAYGTQASVAEEGLMIKVEKYLTEQISETNDTSYVWDGKTYTIQDFRPVQQKWFYMFIDDAGGSYMDKGNQGDYLWEFAKQENGTFRFSCAAANPKQNDALYPNTCAGIVRWDEEDMSTVVNPLVDLSDIDANASYFLDWAFVSEADYAVYADKLALYNMAMKLKDLIDELNTRGIDAGELQKVYDNTNSTKEELQEAIIQAETLISLDDEKRVTPDHPKDFTDRIVNPDFNQEVKGGNGGWTKEGTAKTFEINGWVPAMVEDVMSAPALNLWGSNQNILVSQKVVNIPNGIYELTAGAYSQANGPFIFAGDAQTVITTGGPTPYSVLTYVTDRTVDIGIGFPAEGTQWVMADCFRLKYFGNGYEAYKMWIENTLSGGDSFADKACYAPLKKAYIQSLDILNNATTQEELVAELPRFTALYDSIKANIAAYDDYLALRDDAWQMVLKESYAGDDFDILADYMDLEAEPDEVFPNGNAAYIIGHGTLSTEQIVEEKAFLNQLIQNVLDNCMAAGADATAKLTNPNFDNGLTGWSFNKKLGTPSPGGMTTNPNVERWNQNFDFYQEVSLPNGVYRLDAQAFYRTAANAQAEPEWLNEEAEVLTSLYANTGETLVKNVFEEAQEAGFYKEDNAYTMQDEHVIPNSMKTASEAFAAGLYENSVKGVVWNGKLRIGIRSLNASAADRWSIWDNFRLTFLGMEAEPIAECYDKTLEEAEQILANSELTDDQRASLQTVMGIAVDKSNASGTLSAITQIREVMENINSILTSIETPSKLSQQPATIVGIYSLRGDRTDRLQKGINIVRMSNGQTRKVIVK